jgi:hypothetical protein
MASSPKWKRKTWVEQRASTTKKQWSLGFRLPELEMKVFG